jgi:hypothetical protein
LTIIMSTIWIKFGFGGIVFLNNPGSLRSLMIG